MASFASGLAGTASARWLWAMAGAEVGRGLLSGVITATAEGGRETATRFRVGKAPGKVFPNYSAVVSRGREEGEGGKGGKRKKMLSKAACAFSMGKLRLFSLWLK